MTKNAEEYLERRKNRNKETFDVKSSSDPSIIYKVIRMPNDTWYCSCPGFKYRHQCKHIDEERENYGKK